MGNKITNPKTGRSVKIDGKIGKKIIAELSEDYKTFDALESKYPQIFDISEKINDTKPISPEEEALWKRAFMLSHTVDLTKKPADVVEAIYDKLVMTCDTDEESASNWYHSTIELEDPVKIFDSLYKTFDLQTLECLGL